MFRSWRLAQWIQPQVNLISDTEEGAYPVMRRGREPLQGIFEEATPSLIRRVCYRVHVTPPPPASAEQSHSCLSNLLVIANLPRHGAKEAALLCASACRPDADRDQPQPSRQGLFDKRGAFGVGICLFCKQQ